MERRKLGKTGLEVSVLGFGGAELGFEKVPVETVRTLLDRALDAGLNVVDTASAYLGSEHAIGAAAAGRRREFHLITKCGMTDGFERAEWSAVGIASHVERSLRALRTDHVDVLLLHSCDQETLARGEVIEALERARAKGQTRFVGYSGDGAAARQAIECGRFDVLETSVNIADQESIELLLPAARQAGMGVIAKRPVANAAWRTGSKPVNPYHHVYWDRLLALAYDFLRGDLASAVATALRFTLHWPEVHTAIVGTTKPDRWSENARLLETGRLSEAEVARIRARWRERAGADWGGQV